MATKTRAVGNLVGGIALTALGAPILYETAAKYADLVQRYPNPSPWMQMGATTAALAAATVSTLLVCNGIYAAFVGLKQLLRKEEAKS
jgi:hypothetical protein